jgi:salicylate hydroxylase
VPTAATGTHPWGELWHLVGEECEWRNEVLNARDRHDYSFVDWLYTRTAMTPEEEPPTRPQWTGSWETVNA